MGEKPMSDARALSIGLTYLALACALAVGVWPSEPTTHTAEVLRDHAKLGGKP